MPIHLKNFIEVTRLTKPIGFLLLFWPSAWGLSVAHFFQKDLEIFVYYILLFFCGSILMRSAGCIVNDIIDEKIDKSLLAGIKISVDNKVTDHSVRYRLNLMREQILK